MTPARIRSAAQQAAAASRQRGEMRSAFGQIAWLETRPDSGRVVLVALQNGHPVELTPEPYSVRSRVHEYGGGAWCAAPEGYWFVNAADQALCFQSWASTDEQRIRLIDGCRYGDLCYDPQCQRVIAVEEDHCTLRVTNRLVAIDRNGQRRVLAEGADFYAAPALSADSRQLAWVSWHHPHQPWTATRLEWAALDGQGRVIKRRIVQDGENAGYKQSLQQPRFLPDGRLLVISDRSGWWNLYQVTEQGLQPLYPLEAECAGAPWQLGASSYQPIDNQRVLLSWLQAGVHRWGVLDLTRRALQPLPGGWGELNHLQVDGGRCYALASDYRQQGALLCFEMENGETETLLEGLGDKCAPACTPEPITQPAANGEPWHGFLYQPENANGALILQLHGGPTAYRAAVGDSQRNFWLAEGFSVLDLNYSGSSGYGRAYRQRLASQWGEREVQDILAAGRWALAAGIAKPGRLFLRGNSAGGYSLLRALQQPDNPFRAGLCHYGISDLHRLAQTTHKFESRYLDWLIGDPQSNAARYRQLSPLRNGKGFEVGVLFLQGCQDPVVPMDQTRRLYQQMIAQGLRSRFVGFAEEGHGFHYAASRERALMTECDFLNHAVSIQRGSGAEL